jgi:hypothetical protein
MQANYRYTLSRSSTNKCILDLFPGTKRILLIELSCLGLN